MATPLNQADIAGIADAILGRLIDMSVGLNPTTPQAANIQNGIDEDIPDNGIDRLIDKFNDIMDNVAKTIAASVARITVEGKQPAEDSPRVAPMPGNPPSSSSGGVSPPPTPTTDLRPNAALDAVFGVVSAPTPAPSPNPPPSPESAKPTQQPKIFVTAEAQRENTAARMNQAMSGIGSSSTNNSESKLDELIKAIRDSVAGKKPADNQAAKPEAKESEGLKAIGDIGKTLLKTLIPISIAAAVLGSATSGMSTFLSSFKVLGTVVGTLLTPAFIVGGAALLSFADILTESLLPNLEKWYETFITTSLSAVNWLQKAVIDFANEMLKLIPKLKDVSIALLDFAVGVTKGLANIMLVADTAEMMQTGKNPGRYAETLKIAGKLEVVAAVLKEDRAKDKPNIIPFKDVFEALNIPVVNGVPQIPQFGANEGIAGRMPANIQKMIQQFKFDNAPQPQSMGLAQAAQNAQLAALNVSPFERDMLKLVSEVIEALDRVSAKLKPAVGE